MGRVVRSVGLKGEFKLLLSQDFWPEVLDSAQLRLEGADLGKPARILSRRPAGNCWVLGLEGIESLEEAESHRDWILVFEGETLDVEDPPEVLPFQIAGFQVLLPDGQKLGEVRGLEMIPAQHLLLVQGEEKMYRIPFVEPIVRDLDLKEHRILIDPPDGLLDL
ncbi:MAG: ribosome maturation factor RimM [Candidatus Krumholzibacteria bacterium]|nr:ribosome maturation factor RimM [Candidatus Krumholzibacteria bacterium]